MVLSYLFSIILPSDAYRLTSMKVNKKVEFGKSNFNVSFISFISFGPDGSSFAVPRRMVKYIEYMLSSMADGKGFWLIQE